MEIWQVTEAFKEILEAFETGRGAEAWKIATNWHAKALEQQTRWEAHQEQAAAESQAEYEEALACPW